MEGMEAKVDEMLKCYWTNGGKYTDWLKKMK
jgi:hypothetical protein